MNTDKHRFRTEPETDAAFQGVIRLVPLDGPKYLPLKNFLAGQASSVHKLELNICELIVILRSEPPPQTYHDAAWWANDPAQEQAAAWLEAGWRVADLDLHGSKVSFIRSI